MTVALLATAMAVPLASSFGHSHAAPAATPLPLGTAASFAVLGATTVTNTGPTILTGNLGVSPGTSCTGFPTPCTGGPGVVNGTIHTGTDPVGVQAQVDAHTAYANGLLQPCTTTFGPVQELGGLTLTPGVYCFPSSAMITTGALTLNAMGNPNAVFIFKITSTLVTASTPSVVLTNGGSAKTCDNNGIFWLVGSSATLGTGTSFVGNILANTSITVVSGASAIGSMYALGAAVTLDTNKINTCSTPPIVGKFPASGAFVIGDLSANSGAPVTWWSSQWSALNALSGTKSPDPGFYGWAHDVNTTPPVCGRSWESDPPNHPPAPSTVPPYMLVLVSSNITHHNIRSNGNIVEVVIVKTDPGYTNTIPVTGPGTGTIVGVYCHI
jgi:Ice-binding-like